MRNLLPIVACGLAACSPEAPPSGNSVNHSTMAERSDTPVPAPEPAPAADASPAPRPVPPASDRTPVDEAPFAEDGAQGAANVVQTYHALIEAGKYREAYRLWEPGAAGMSAQAFAESFARYAEYHAEVGAPGRVDAGAGQRYVTVPVRVYGKLAKGGRSFDMRGEIVLHRTADIDGATAEQKRWHIRSSDIRPRALE
jgi:hypothetical protein